jgi:hypothetical protein
MGGGGVSGICFAHVACLALVAVGGVLQVVRWQGMGGNVVGAFAMAWWYWGVVGALLAAQQQGRRWGGDIGACFAQLASTLG